MHSMPLHAVGVHLDSSWTEQIILMLADEFNIRIAWDRNSAILTGAFAIAGGMLGGYTGGRVGAAIGAGVGGATGFVVSTVVSLREVWDSVKENLKELFFIIINFLRRLNAEDYARAFDMLMVCTASRRELVYMILDFITDKLGREVFSSISAAGISA
ncbi:unnamed protein product, partial [Iphiclides podalirius]